MSYDLTLFHLEVSSVSYLKNSTSVFRFVAYVSNHVNIFIGKPDLWI